MSEITKNDGQIIVKLGYEMKYSALSAHNLCALCEKILSESRLSTKAMRRWGFHYSISQIH